MLKGKRTAGKARHSLFRQSTIHGRPCTWLSNLPGKFPWSPHLNANGQLIHVMIHVFFILFFICLCCTLTSFCKANGMAFFVQIVHNPRPAVHVVSQFAWTISVDVDSRPINGQVIPRDDPCIILTIFICLCSRCSKTKEDAPFVREVGDV